MLISGAGAVKGNLRALNQSVSSQVALLMKDPTRLARRAGVSAQQRPRVLCQSAQVSAEPSLDGVAEPASGLDQQKDVAEQDELGSDAFDDGEFYTQLLKEFLDSNSNGNLAVSGGYPQVCLCCNSVASRTTEVFMLCVVLFTAAFALFSVEPDATCCHFLLCKRSVGHTMS